MYISIYYIIIYIYIYYINICMYIYILQLYKYFLICWMIIGHYPIIVMKIP